MQERWEHFRHGADIGVRGFGPTKAAAFVQAAIALTAVITEPSAVHPQEVVNVACMAPDDELLLVDWLNALIYEMAIRKMLFGRFEVDLSPGRLKAKAWGETIDVPRHQPTVEIKGATCTELRVHVTDDAGWVAQCVVDV
ncbi:MAG: archease [Verrucomicrobia bacterium]|nr:archease [Verrucomicrobiota bacterium]